jgi:short-subunit dehydrogenase
MARRIELLESVAEECLKLGAKQVLYKIVDVADEKEFIVALSDLDHKLSTDIFIANAGIGLNGSLRNEFELYKKTFAVNFMGAINGLEWMKVKMLERKKGTLVGVSSVAGARGMPVTGAYSSSKSALTIYLEALRIDLSPHNIRVLTVAPGFIKTAMTDQNTFAMPFMIKASKAAEIFTEKIIAGKELIIAPWQFHYIYRLLQFIPDFFYYYVMKKVAKSKAIKHQKKVRSIN